MIRKLNEWVVPDSKVLHQGKSKDTVEEKWFQIDNGALVSIMRRKRFEILLQDVENGKCVGRKETTSVIHRQQGD